MNKTIHIREAVTPEEVERFWQELHAYHARDIFPDPAEEDRVQKFYSMALLSKHLLLH